MAGVIDTIAVLGLGKIGHLVATLLFDTGFLVTGIDQLPRTGTVYPQQAVDLTAPKLLKQILEHHDAVISCLPYHCNLTIAHAAHDLKRHYFDLTEDTATGQAIAALHHQAGAVLAPHCGLAPGLIAIVGASLTRSFDTIRSIRLRVGALPRHPTGRLGYAFNWSPQGVVNEYLNDCEVIEDGRRKWVSPLEWLEHLVIDGRQLEAFTTSGGLGTMCDTYAGRVDNLDYKSIRYPGHAALMNFFFHELLMREDRDRAGQILVHAKPPVNDDVVYLHVAVEGSQGGRLVRHEFVRTYLPRELCSRQWRAIAWTTAASACSVIELVATGRLPARGLIRQEDIDLDTFLATHNGRHFH